METFIKKKEMEGRDIEEEEEQQQQPTCTQQQNAKKKTQKRKNDSGEVIYIHCTCTTYIHCTSMYTRIYMHGSHVGQQLHVCTCRYMYILCTSTHRERKFQETVQDTWQNCTSVRA